MEWLILAALIVIGVSSNAEATVPVKPTLTEIPRLEEITVHSQQKIPFQSQQKEIIDKFHDSGQCLISNSEFHKMTIQEPQFVLLGPVFEEFVEAARQIKPSHLALALRFVRNSQMSTEEIIEIIMNWPPKKLEHLLSKEMRQEFDLLVKALQKLPKEYLLKGIRFIRSSKETSGQLASLITTDF